MVQSATKEQVLNKVESLIKQSKGLISPADAAAATGYSLSEVKDALSRLIELYESRVSMNKDTGDILFIFKYPFTIRGAKTFNEKLAAFMLVFWKIFKIIYKAAIGVILIVYTAVFALILLAILLKAGSDDDDNGFGNIIGGLFRAILEGLSWAAWSRSADYAMDPSGMRYKKFAPEKNKGKGFVASVFSFVFGPERPDYDPLCNAKEVAAYLREVKKNLTSGQIIALSGVTYDQAESELANYASRFNGELSVNTDGIVIAEFPEMAKRAAKGLEGGKIEYYKDEVEAPYELTGNTGGKNALIIIMNLFNLIMSFVGLGYFSFDIENVFLSIALGWVPLAFSGFFFLIPLFRIPYVIRMKSKRNMNILRKKIVGAIIEQPEAISFPEIVSKGRIQDEEKPLAEELMPILTAELQGEINLSDDGSAVYQFERLALELKAG